MQSNCSNGNAMVIQSPTGQLTGSSRTNILSAAIIYTDKVMNPLSTPKTKTTSSSDYIAFKKAQILAASTPTVYPQQSVIITDLQAFGPGPL